ncbi:uncharacterized protein OCT59_009350 [Rhizophagus irregularis]|uniref:Uncharacterized protein n=2 Tax=Rhizophagus irregularis TaxID=588596 RepID=A0A015KDJ0_RHIIW|nr:hypothetical protein RirG_001680 [Rhizophagus irregularis DAOM 197198w]UZO18025.1 hypothetical protein OCT59_009350 [Rhizophagus irregularis]
MLEALKLLNQRFQQSTIKEWIFLSYPGEIKHITEELKCNVMEFIDAQIGHNYHATESHPQAFYTSQLLNFTSDKLNGILESEDSQASGISDDLNDCIINN